MTRHEPLAVKAQTAAAMLDLPQGPESSVFCAAVAEAVVSEVSTLRDRLARMEGAIECARGLVDTPIARRKLNLSPDDPMLIELRAAYPAALTDGGSNG